MSEAEAFLATIYAAPDDDLPRLVYADWLDEQGNGERAEFIRLHCRFDRGESLKYAEDERLHDLADRHGAAWSAHLPRVKGVEWRFRRGFPEELDVGIDPFLAAYDSWAALPRVRYLLLCDATARSMRAFAERAWNPGWVGVRFVDDPHPMAHSYPHDPSAGVVPLALSPQAAGLRELGFSHYGVGDAGVTALCDSPYLAGLAVLEVSREEVADPRLVARFGPALRPNF